MRVAVGRYLIEIEFERRPDGGLRVWSDELHGLVLSHADCALVLREVEPAALEILKHMPESELRKFQEIM